VVRLHGFDVLDVARDELVLRSDQVAVLGQLGTLGGNEGGEFDDGSLELVDLLGSGEPLGGELRVADFVEELDGGDSPIWRFCNKGATEDLDFWGGCFPSRLGLGCRYLWRALDGEKRS
jgi:hypothetical protein